MRRNGNINKKLRQMPHYENSTLLRCWPLVMGPAVRG